MANQQIEDAFNGICNTAFMNTAFKKYFNIIRNEIEKLERNNVVLTDALENQYQVVNKYSTSSALIVDQDAYDNAIVEAIYRLKTSGRINI